jgi:hypothetical protein
MALRLERHHLRLRAGRDQLVDVVRDMVGLHAQVMSAAELQLAARVDGIHPADVQDALWTERRLVKAWSMRGTLHLLTPEDLIDFVAAAPTRERWHEAPWLRFVGMTERQVEALIAAVGDLLSDQPMTRAALADGIAERLGDPNLASALRSGWGTFLGAPGQRGLLCFGPSGGRNVTFVRPSAWLGRPIAPSEQQSPADAIDALASLVRRFLAAFPGSSRNMIGRWWGAARASLIGQALERLGDDVTGVEVEGVGAWTLRQDLPSLLAAKPFESVRLLPGFDPFVNELPRRTEGLLPVTRHERIYRTAGWVTPVVLVDGRVAGTWEVTVGSKGGLAVQPFELFPKTTVRGLDAEADRLAEFLGRPLRVSLAGPLADV